MNWKMTICMDGADILFISIASLIVLLFTSCSDVTKSDYIDKSAKPRASSTATITENVTVSKETIVTTKQKQDLIKESRLIILPSCKLSVLSAAFPTVPFSAETWNGCSPFVEVNENEPLFEKGDKINTEPFEYYSEHDNLGRCGSAFANICKELMPTEEREKIGMIKPSGWKLSKYDKSVIQDMYLFNRCHLIAFMLAGENANEKNLITGTRYLNVEGMLPFEEKVRNYLYHNPENHVLYRVTPIYKGEDLVAQGVLMEAYSVEDKGQLRFCVYCYNVQPFIEIDYSNGDNKLKDDYSAETEYFTEQKPASTTIGTTAAQPYSETIEIETKSQGYVLNTNTKKIHLPSCDSVNQMKEKNKQYTDKTVNELIEEGYKPCKICNPQ